MENQVNFARKKVIYMIKIGRAGYFEPIEKTLCLKDRDLNKCTNYTTHRTSAKFTAL